MKMKSQENHGITLIALVVTIIVLLLLAGISIMMLTGQNGILNRTSEAKEKTQIAEEKEAIALAMTALRIDKTIGEAATSNSKITPEELKTEMDKGAPVPESVEQGEDYNLEIAFGPDRNNRIYEVTQEGEIKEIVPLTPEEAAKIVEFVCNVGENIYVLTAGGEVKETTITEGNIFDIVETTDEVITTKGVRKKSGNCFIDKKGKVYTWGDNYYGQLGNGNYDDSNTPICISDIENNALNGKNIVDFYYSYDYDNVFARDDEGKLYTWGDNWCGQLGNGTSEYRSSIPICISEIEGSALKGKNIVDVYTDGSTVIARDDDGKVYTWGYNYYGQLGNGTTVNSSSPECISDIENNALNGKNIVDVYSDGDTVIARDDEGKLYSWGRNWYGELGNGTTIKSSIPICISEIEGSALKGKNIVDVYSDGYTVIARDDKGKLYTWGYNGSGQLGNGETVNSSIPICISEIEGSALKGKNIVDVYTNGSTVIARDEDGKLYTWGDNWCGQLGNGTYDDSNIPICISESGSALKGKNIVDVYYDYSTVITRDDEGKLYLWGRNNYGQLGNGQYEDSYVPICISETEGSALKGKNIVDVCSDGYFVVVRDNEGKIYTWGYNYYGQLGNGQYEDSYVPICISDENGSELNGEKIKNMDIYSNYYDGYYYDGCVYITETGKCYVNTWRYQPAPE